MRRPDGGLDRPVGAGSGSAAAPPNRCWAGVLLCLAACGGDPAGPADRPARLDIADGHAQFTLPGTAADLPLQVRATDPSTGVALKDVAVSWRVTAGTGAALTVIAERTNGLGFASARLRVGPDTGTYSVQATAPRLVGDPPTLTVRAVASPVLDSVVPAIATAGQTVTVFGNGFSTAAGDNAVLFGGLRGRVLSATRTRISVEVPACALTRSVDLRVALGAVASQTARIQTVAGGASPFNLGRGQVLRLETAGLDCVRLASTPPGARFLVVTQNSAESSWLPLRYEFLAVAAGGPAAPMLRPPREPPHVDAASAFEETLRRRERAFGSDTWGAEPDRSASGAAPIPVIGDRREFNVITPDNKTRRVTAVVQAISQRSILYVDRDAPAPGLTDADLQRFGSLFDDPIHATISTVFGSPSDIDANARIIVLFTPAVNALTKREDSGFIAGYFYGCDLLETSRCSASNRGEIFYSMVPDPAGTFSGARSKDVVLRTVPGVLAHEFQHMITFSRKGNKLDVLWLSEGLAHAAEDVVGDVLLARGDPVTANDFKRPNFVRAQLYLRQVANTSLVSVESPGTLEQRGGDWLLVRYLTEHYGGQSLLGRLTGSPSTGAANIVQATGRPWPELLAEFAIALWADRSPELAGTTLDPRHTFGSFDLRATLGAVGGFPLNPPVVGYSDLQLTSTMPSAAQDYLLIQAPASTATLHLAFTGLRGEPFTGSAQLALLRIR